MPDLNETAATVNGKAIKLEEVERVIKQQGQGQEAKLSPLELAQARLQVLQTLIQEEVLFQKAEKENTVPTDEEVTAEYNKLKTRAVMSAKNSLMKELQELRMKPKNRFAKKSKKIWRFKTWMIKSPAKSSRRKTAKSKRFTMATKRHLSRKKALN